MTVELFSIINSIERLRLLTLLVDIGCAAMVRMGVTKVDNTKREPMQLIRGNTYPHRHRIKSLGGLWRPAEKAWLVPNSVVSYLKEIVAYGPTLRPAGEK